MKGSAEGTSREAQPSGATDHLRALTHRVGLACGIALAGAVTLASLEGAVRLLRLAPPLTAEYAYNVADPHLPYRRVPLSVARGRSRSGEFDFEYRHNSLGFRDVEHNKDKADGVYRLLFLGDSFTYGAGARFEETWPSVLERLLNEGGKVRPVESIRMGLPRYFPGAERIVLEHYGLAFKPDMVLVGVLPNDVIDTREGLDAIRVASDGSIRSREGEAFGSAGEWLFDHSHVGRIVLARVAAQLRIWRDPVQFDDVYEENGRCERDWVQLESDLTDMQRLSENAGSTFVVVSIPQKGPWTARHGYPDRRLSVWAASRGLRLVETLPHFAASTAQGRHLFWERDGHCTPEGYALIGGAVFESLELQHRLAR